MDSGEEGDDNNEVHDEEMRWSVNSEEEFLAVGRGKWGSLRCDVNSDKGFLSYGDGGCNQFCEMS